MAELSPEDTFVLIADQQAATRINTSHHNVDVVSVNLSAPPAEAAAAEGGRSIADMLRLTRAVRAARCDVFFFPSVYSFFPLMPGQRALLGIHDVIPDEFPHLCFPSARAHLNWKIKMRLALLQTRLILTVSKYAADKIHQTLGVPRSRIRVVEEAPASVFSPTASASDIRAEAARSRLPTGASWFLYVGGFSPHKRVDILVRAHAAIAASSEGEPPYLLLVGPTHGDVFYNNLSEIRSVIAECGTGNLVRWPGAVSDEELRLLYCGALALALPSESEGFGLTAVEAAACGCPVVVTVESPLPELLEGGGFFVRPGELGELTTALALLWRNERLRGSMGAQARERASGLTWRRTARHAIAALKEAAERVDFPSERGSSTPSA